MSPRIPKSFSVRTMLVVVASIAVAAFIARDYARVRNAREHFTFKTASWKVGNITFEEVILASEELAFAGVKIAMDYTAGRHNTPPRVHELLAPLP